MATWPTTFDGRREAVLALLAQAREVVADSRNHRHLAGVRRALLEAKSGTKKHPAPFVIGQLDVDGLADAFDGPHDGERGSAAVPASRA